MRKTLLHWLILFLLASPFFTGCSVSRAQKLDTYWTNRPSTIQVTNGQTTESVRLQYTGCGGFWLDYGGESILVDPFFSNVGMLRAALYKYRSDTALINAFFKKQLGQTRDSAGKISAVLISHAHHDHLADVPALLQNNLSSSQVAVFGSRTMVNLLRSFPGLVNDTAAQYVNLEREFSLLSATAELKSQPEISSFFYTANRRIRFAAIPSNHAGHFQFFQPHKIPFTEGQIEQPLPKPPDGVLDFKEGQNFNYLIDLLDEEGAPVFRIFSNAGAACDSGVGFPPAKLLEQKPVDLLLICGASFSIAKNYPMPLLEHLKPKALFVVHWENFFKPIPKLHRRPQVVPKTNIPKLMEALEAFAKARTYPKTIILEQPLGRAITFRF